MDVLPNAAIRSTSVGAANGELPDFVDVAERLLQQLAFWPNLDECVSELHNHRGVIAADEYGSVWAVRIPGRCEMPSVAWLPEKALSVAELIGAAIGPVTKYKRSKSIVRQVEAADHLRAVALLFELADFAVCRSVTEFSMPLPCQMRRDQEEILSVLTTINIGRVELVPGRWRFATVVREPAVMLASPRDERVDFKISEHLPWVMQSFLDAI